MPVGLSSRVLETHALQPLERSWAASLDFLPDIPSGRQQSSLHLTEIVDSRTSSGRRSLSSPPARRTTTAFNESAGADDEDHKENPRVFPYQGDGEGKPLGRNPYEINGLVGLVGQRAEGAKGDAARAQRVAELALVRAPSLKGSLEGTEEAVRGILFAGKVNEGHEAIHSKIEDFRDTYDFPRENISKGIEKTMAALKVNKKRHSVARKKLEDEALKMFTVAFEELDKKGEIEECPLPDIEKKTCYIL